MSTLVNTNHTCPVCKEKFEATAQLSYSIFGRNLDFKPCGAAMIPAPVPQCPKCHFVFFDDMFSDEDISQLKKSFAQNNIFETEPDMPEYFYLAKELELLGRDSEKILGHLISAVWQLPSRSPPYSKTLSHYDDEKIVFETEIRYDKDIVYEAKSRRILQEHENTFRKITGMVFGYFDKMTKDNKDYDTFRLMRIDFLRRRGDFDEAKTLLDVLQGDCNLTKDESINKALEYQRELIGAHDQNEHEWPEVANNSSFRGMFEQKVEDRQKTEDIRYDVPAGKYLMIAYLLLSLEKKPERSMYKYFAFFFGYGCFGEDFRKNYEPDIDKGDTLKKWQLLFHECENILGRCKTGAERFNAFQSEIDALIDGWGNIPENSTTGYPCGCKEDRPVNGPVGRDVDKREFYANKCYGDSRDLWDLAKLAYLNSSCSINTTEMLRHIAGKWNVDMKNVPVIEKAAKAYADIEKKWAEAEAEYGEKTAEENRNICNGFIEAVNKSRLWAELGKVGIEREGSDKRLEWSHICKAHFCGRTKLTLVPDGKGDYILKDC